MIFKILLPLLALSGIGLAVVEVIGNERTAPPVSSPIALPQSPYPNAVAGAGLVEANSENIAIASPVGGIVTHVFIRVGASVKAGDPLFEIDDRAARAALASRQAAVQLSEVDSAQARYDLGVTEALAAKGVSAANDLEEKRFAAKKAAAQVIQAEADEKAAETTLDLLTVRAPVAGRILQLKVHAGELTPDASASGGPPLMLLGNISPLNVRAEVNENDAWRIPSGASATGVLRGNPQLKVALAFVRFEPYVVPKASLTGSSTERVDTRVLQVIFRFDPGGVPIFVGQQMDVFIDTSNPADVRQRLAQAIGRQSEIRQVRIGRIDRVGPDHD